MIVPGFWQKIYDTPISNDLSVAWTDCNPGAGIHESCEGQAKYGHFVVPFKIKSEWVLWPSSNYNSEQHVLKLFFQKMEKQFVVNPPLITVGIIHPTHFVSEPHMIHFFAAKITNGDKHCPVALPQPITVICCFCAHVWYRTFFWPFLAIQLSVDKVLMAYHSHPYYIWLLGDSRSLLHEKPP